MSDEYVLKSQKYLNSMYGGHPSWVTLKENGNTGTLMMEGLIRAFQIENNVPNATGYLGPYTVNVMKNLPKISKMSVDDDSNPNVCLIQCALFCKGYNAGGITGIYYTTGVNAVKELQKDANVKVTGVIDWKVWVGLFSMNWFKLVSGGNETIRKIQRQLNHDYSDVISVQACDGSMSRNTALSLLGALQAEEGIVDWIDDLNDLNFGPTTASNCPTLSLNNTKVRFNKIAQYGLYFNGMNQTDFDGVFDQSMATNVGLFQDKYALTGNIDDIRGSIGVSTMKSLLTSKGDTERKALACDCSTILNSQQATDLHAAGYRYVGRYLTGTVGVGNNERSKALTVSEIKRIQAAGLSIFPIYQDGGYYANYFSQNLQGSYDAVTAINKAKKLGFASGTTIYFAVDFDCLEYQTENLIIPYFEQIKTVFSYTNINTSNYKVGIYAPRYVCTLVSQKNLVDKSFVADMSTGFSGNLGYVIPDNWSFDQFYETSFTSTPTFDIDKVGVSGKDGGCRSFNSTVDDINELQEAREKYVNKCLQGLNYLDKTAGIELDFENGGQYNLGIVNVNGLAIEGKLKVSTAIKNSENSQYVLHIQCDENGNLTTDTLNKIKEISKLDDYQEYSDYMQNMLINMSTKIQVGNILFRFEKMTDASFKVLYTVETDDLKSFAGVSGSVSMTLELNVFISKELQGSLVVDETKVVAKATKCALLITVVVAAFKAIITKLPDILIFVFA